MRKSLSERIPRTNLRRLTPFLSWSFPEGGKGRGCALVDDDAVTHSKERVAVLRRGAAAGAECAVRVGLNWKVKSSKLTGPVDNSNSC